MDWSTILPALIILATLLSMMMANRSTSVRDHVPKLLDKFRPDEIGVAMREETFLPELKLMLDDAEIERLLSMPNNLQKMYLSARLNARQQEILASKLNDERQGY